MKSFCFLCYRDTDIVVFIQTQKKIKHEATGEVSGAFPNIPPYDCVCIWCRSRWSFRWDVNTKNTCTAIKNSIFLLDSTSTYKRIWKETSFYTEPDQTRGGGVYHVQSIWSRWFICNGHDLNGKHLSLCHLDDDIDSAYATAFSFSLELTTVSYFEETLCGLGTTNDL